MARQSLEWHFFDAEKETEWSKRTNQLADQESSSHSEETICNAPKMRYVYELICAIALLYGVVAYLLWQHVAQRNAVIEGDVAALRDEVAALQRSGLEGGKGTIYEDSSTSLHIETTYLHFAVSPKTAEVVRESAPHIDAKFQQLHRDFGLPLSLTAEKLRIIVAPATNGNDLFTAEHQLVVAQYQSAVKQYGISKADALTIGVLGKLSQQLLEQAINHRTIKPQWQGMVLALKTHVELDNGYNHNWQWEDSFLLQRYNAQSRSLELVHELIHESVEGPDEQWSQVSPTAYATANPLMEFILVTYGYDKVPELLDAFEEHASWETLTPALFHLTADEFEEQWHAYLRKHYPIPR